VHLILDDLSTHKAPQVHRWLLRHPRFHLRFTPTYGSWLNLVAWWFSALTTKKLQRSAHRSVKESPRTSSRGSRCGSHDPKPFTWTKSAEAILDSMGR
jgi:transposase